MTARFINSIIVSDYATLIRVVVILFIVSVIVIATRRYQPIDSIPPRSLVLLGLSGAAFLREKLTLGNWLGVALVVAGAILVSR